MENDSVTLIEEEVSRPRVGKLYTVELLRVIFILGIIVHHIGGIMNTDFRNQWHNLLGTQYDRLWFEVEFFFMIGGFFLFRSLNKPNNKALAHIEKLWWRLTPGLIIAFLTLVILGVRSWARLPGLLFETQGLSIIPHPIGGGDWFIGAYFWTSALYVGLFFCGRKVFWFSLGVFLYFILCIQNNADPSFYAATTGQKISYYTILGTGFARAVSCVGLGIFTAFLSERISLKKNVIIQIGMTLAEGALLYMIISYCYKSSSVKFHMLDVKLAFCILLISIDHSYGYISYFMNRMKWIGFVSRYTYSFLLGHIVMLNLFVFYKGFGLPKTQQLVYVFWGGVIYGIIEFHLMKKLMDLKHKVLGTVTG